MRNRLRHTATGLAGLLHTANDQRLWTLCGSDGRPDYFRVLRRDDRLDANTARGIDLFTTLAAATKWLEQTQDDGDPVLTAGELDTAGLLSHMSRVDIVAIDMRNFALTKRGAAALEQSDLATPNELLAALSGNKPT